MTKTGTIESFAGDYEFLSNFYLCPVMFDGVLWKSVEHAYQAAKTHSSKERTTIFGTASPGRAKRLGMKVTLRPDWESVKVDTMEQLLRDKFERNADLRQKLQAQPETVPQRR